MPLGFCFILPIHSLRALTFPLPPITVVTQIRPVTCHSRLSSPLLITVRAFIFIAGRFSALSSLVDSRIILPTHAM